MSLRMVMLIVALMTTARGDSSNPPEGSWNIQKATLSRRPDKNGHFIATVSKKGEARKTTIEDDVPMDELASNYIASDKLILFGHGGNADVVVIFDLLGGKKIDWFYCYQPQRVFNNLIAYVEWYPNHGPDTYTDVVAVYDTRRTAAENRQGRFEGTPVAPTNPTRVGFPVYPEFNATHHSYSNTVEAQAEVRLVLGHPNFLGLGNDRLIIAVGEEPGGDASTLRNHLESIDLSAGISRPTNKSFLIPTGSLLTKSAPAYIEITSMDAASDNTVRLHVPKTEYGVDSILVEIP